jgi:cation diffusion facilitator CzcD-associated flavoprotein CzcO
MKKEIADVLIIGAGPSGMVSAAYLQKQGIKVVVEKSSFPKILYWREPYPSMYG